MCNEKGTGTVGGLERVNLGSASGIGGAERAAGSGSGGDVN